MKLPDDIGAAFRALFVSESVWRLSAAERIEAIKEFSALLFVAAEPDQWPQLDPLLGQLRPAPQLPLGRVEELIAAADPAERIEIIHAVASRRGSATAERDRARNQAYVDAVAPYGGPKTRAAKELAADLTNYAASGWRLEKHLVVLPEGIPPHRQAWHRILRLTSTGDRPLKSRQILHILNIWSA